TSASVFAIAIDPSDTTAWTQVLAAHNAGKQIFATYWSGVSQGVAKRYTLPLTDVYSSNDTITTFVFSASYKDGESYIGRIHEYKLTQSGWNGPKEYDVTYAESAGHAGNASYADEAGTAVTAGYAERADYAIGIKHVGSAYTNVGAIGSPIVCPFSSDVIPNSTTSYNVESLMSKLLGQYNQYKAEENRCYVIINARTATMRITGFYGNASYELGAGKMTTIVYWGGQYFCR
uniref:hypothetical protein n=1 Tax=uncultured Fibrobacter sp. TaxID=261512 RepID=UPI0026218E66